MASLELEQEAMSGERTESHLQPFPCSTEAEEPLPLLSGSDLVDTFLATIADPFGDQNLKGTKTRIRTMLREADLSQPAEMLPYLIRAYVIARDTRTIRSQPHPQTGQANRMPLFCAMVQRLVAERRHGPYLNDSWQQVEATIATDAHLATWWSAHRHLVDLSDVQASHGPMPRLPSGKTTSNAEEVAITTEPDPYTSYINALMSRYREPAALQEVG